MHPPRVRGIAAMRRESRLSRKYVMRVSPGSYPSSFSRAASMSFTHCASLAIAFRIDAEMRATPNFAPSGYMTMRGKARFPASKLPRWGVSRPGPAPAIAHVTRRLLLADTVFLRAPGGQLCIGHALTGDERLDHRETRDQQSGNAHRAHPGSPALADRGPTDERAAASCAADRPEPVYIVRSACLRASSDHDLVWQRGGALTRPSCRRWPTC